MRAVAGLLLLGACAQDGPPLSRLVDAWTSRSAEAAGPMITGSLVLGGLAAQLCDDGSLPWKSVVPGDKPPMDPLLWLALGQPTVEHVEIYTLSMEVGLSGVTLFGREGARLKASTSVADGPVEVEIALYEGSAPGADTGSQPEPVSFVRTTLTSSAGCDSGSPRVSGSVKIQDELGKAHTVTVPSEGSFGAGLLLDGAERWLPLDGAVTWASVVEGQVVSLTTRDASQLQVDGGGVSDTAGGTVPLDTGASFAWQADWASTITGDGWSGEAVVGLRLGD